MLKNFLKAPLAYILLVIGVLLFIPALGVLLSPIQGCGQKMFDVAVFLLMVYGIHKITYHCGEEIRLSKKSSAK